MKSLLVALLCSVITAWGSVQMAPDMGQPWQRDILSELSASSSPNLSIIFPGSSAFENATHRWSLWRPPQVSAVVEPENEEDVQAIIHFANNYDIPFFAMVGGHGAIDSLGNVHDGIQISMARMKYVSVALDGKTATIGAGAKSKDITEALQSAGKRTVTGSCECVGNPAVVMGGGHGFLQGQYGLLIDQLVSARMVLANGTVVMVSEKSYPDLFWAVRGAGHNFGIITEYVYKIYDAPNSTWAFESFTFKQDQLEDLYTVTNDMVESQPPRVYNYGALWRVPDVDPDHAIISYYFLWDGPLSELQAYSTRIHELNPYSVQSGELPYNQIPSVVGYSNDDFACQSGIASILRFPIYLKSYDIPSLRQCFNAFDEGMQRQPKFNNSFFLVEGYAMQAVQAVSSESTAFAHRGANLLLSPAVIYQDDSLTAAAIEFGRTMRELLLAGSGSEDLNAYVNYAHGDESLEALYGYEPWRVEKLRKLKGEYDPNGRFNFYAPIA